MRYNKSRSNYSAPRNMVIKYAGPCRCCGATIPAGAYATYYPSMKAIGHIGGLEGNSATCYANMCAEMEAKGLPTSRKPIPEPRDPGFVDLDRMYEDQCSDICGR